MRTSFGVRRGRRSTLPYTRIVKSSGAPGNMDDLEVRDPMIRVLERPGRLQKNSDLDRAALVVCA
jgi:hypothetical protein